MKLKIVTANGYVWNKSVDALEAALEATEADVIGGQEAWRSPRRLTGYRRLGCHFDGGREGREVPIFLREDHRYLGHGSYFVKRDLGGKVTPARWITWARFAVGAEWFALIDTHFDAALQRPDGEVWDAPRVELAAHQMHLLLREIRAQRRAGFTPLVTADFNYRLHGSIAAWRWSPHRALPRAGMTYFAHHVDGIAVPRSAKPLRVEPLLLPGSDHKGLSGTFDL